MDETVNIATVRCSPAEKQRFIHSLATLESQKTAHFFRAAMSAYTRQVEADETISV